MAVSEPRRGSGVPGGVSSLLLVALLAAGCAGVRAPEVAEPDLDFAPSEGAPPPAAGPLSSWWTSFGDPALDAVVERALAGNLTLAEAAARLAQAAADAGVAESALWPQVGVGANRLAERRNFIGLPIPGIGEDEVLTAEYVQYGLSLDLSWEANLWRDAAPRARAAGAGFGAAVAEVAGARASLAGQAARLYFLAVEAKEQARLAEAAVANLEETTAWLRRRARIGEAALVEVDAAEARLAEARSVAAARRQARAASVRSLETLFTDYPDGVPGPGWDLGSGLPDSLGPAPGGVPADLVARRPDVAGAERRLAASRELTTIARRARYPQFALTSSAGTATAGLRQLVDGDFSVWSLIAGIAAPVFQGGRIRARIRHEEARDQEALAVYARTVLTAYQEVEAGLAAEETLREAGDRAREARTAADLIVARTAARWREGLATRRAVLDARAAAIRAESADLSQARARLDNRVNLFLALGGGFKRPSRPADADAAGGHR